MTDELPNGWQFAKLSEITSKVGSGATPRGGSESYHRTGIPLIRSMNVRFEGFTPEGLAFLNEKQAEALKEVTVRSGDVLLNITGASIGRVTQAPIEMEGARVNQHVCIIRLKDRLDANFLARYLASPAVQEMIWTEQYGVTRQALTKGQILDFRIPLPPLAEQQRIVAKLETLLTRVNACQQRLTQIPVVLKRFRQSVLAAACSGRLTADWRRARMISESDGGNDLPDSWESVAFGELIGSGLQNGLYKPATSYGSGTLIVRIDDFHDGTIAAWKDLKRLRLSAKEVDKFALRGGDILINRVNSPKFLGKSAIVVGLKEPCVYESNMMRLRLDASRVSPEYTALYLLSPRGLAELRKNAKHAVNQSSINQEDVKVAMFALPTLLEQEQIVRRVNSLFALAEHIEVRYMSVQPQVERLSQAILDRAFQGEFVPTEAELAEREGRSYESAEQLLQRIRSSRDRATPSGVTSNGRRKQTEG
jgi:type I restriction enzyme, S subunit